MELLADENIETPWLQALRDDGHDVVRVVDIEELGAGASDPRVLGVASQRTRVLLIAPALMTASDGSTLATSGLVTSPGRTIVI